MGLRRHRRARGRPQSEEPNVLYYDGGTWNADPTRYNDITALWGFAGGPAYATSQTSVLVRMPYPAYPSGYLWSPVYSGSEGSRHLLSIWGTPSSDLYAVGCGRTIMHYDGASWSHALP